MQGFTWSSNQLPPPNYQERPPPQYQERPPPQYQERPPPQYQERPPPQYQERPPPQHQERPPLHYQEQFPPKYQGVRNEQSNMFQGQYNAQLYTTSQSRYSNEQQDADFRPNFNGYNTQTNRAHPQYPYAASNKKQHYPPENPNTNGYYAQFGTQSNISSPQNYRNTGHNQAHMYWSSQSDHGISVGNNRGWTFHMYNNGSSCSVSNQQLQPVRTAPRHHQQQFSRQHSGKQHNKHHRTQGCHPKSTSRAHKKGVYQNISKNQAQSQTAVSNTSCNSTRPLSSAQSGTSLPSNKLNQSPVFSQPELRSNGGPDVSTTQSQNNQSTEQQSQGTNSGTYNVNETPQITKINEAQPKSHARFVQSLIYRLLCTKDNEQAGTQQSDERIAHHNTGLEQSEVCATNRTDHHSKKPFSDPSAQCTAEPPSKRIKCAVVQRDYWNKDRSDFGVQSVRSGTHQTGGNENRPKGSSQHIIQYSTDPVDCLEAVFALQKVSQQVHKAIAIVPPISQQTSNTAQVADTSPKRADSPPLKIDSVWSLEESDAQKITDDKLPESPSPTAQQEEKSLEIESTSNIANSYICSTITTSTDKCSANLALLVECQNNVQQGDCDSSNTSFDLSSVPVVKYTLGNLMDSVKSLELMELSSGYSEKSESPVNTILKLCWNGNKVHLVEKLLSFRKEMGELSSVEIVSDYESVVFESIETENLKKLAHCEILNNEMYSSSEEFRSSWLNVDGQPADIEKVLSEPMLDDTTVIEVPSQLLSDNTVVTLANLGVNSLKDLPEVSSTEKDVNPDMCSPTALFTTQSGNDREEMDAENNGHSYAGLSRIKFLSSIPSEKGTFLSSVSSEKGTYLSSVPSEKGTFLSSVSSEKGTYLSSVPSEKGTFLSSVSSEKGTYLSSVPSEKGTFLSSVSSEKGTYLSSVSSEKGTYLSSVPSEKGTYLSSVPSEKGTFLSSISSEKGTFLSSVSSEKGTFLSSISSEKGTYLSSVPSEKGTFLSSISSEKGTYLSSVPSERGTYLSSVPSEKEDFKKQEDIKQNHNFNTQPSDNSPLAERSTEKLTHCSNKIEVFRQDSEQTCHNVSVSDLLPLSPGDNVSDGVKNCEVSLSTETLCISKDTWQIEDISDDENRGNKEALNNSSDIGLVEDISDNKNTGNKKVLPNSSDIWLVEDFSDDENPSNKDTCSNSSDICVVEDVSNDENSSDDSLSMEITVLSSEDAKMFFQELEDEPECGIKTTTSNFDCPDLVACFDVPSQPNYVTCSLCASKMKISNSTNVTDSDADLFCPQCWEQAPLLELEEEPCSPMTNEADVLGSPAKSNKQGLHCSPPCVKLEVKELDVASKQEYIVDERLTVQISDHMVKSEPGQISPSLELKVKELNVASPETCIVDEGLTEHKRDIMVKSELGENCCSPCVDLKVEEPTVALLKESIGNEKLTGQKCDGMVKSELGQTHSPPSLDLKVKELTVTSTKKYIVDEGLTGQKRDIMVKSELRENCSSPSPELKVMELNVALPETCVVDEGLTGQKRDIMVKSELGQNCSRPSFELEVDEPTVASTKKCINEGLKGQKSKSLFKSELRQYCSPPSLKLQAKELNVAPPVECTENERLTGPKRDMVKSELGENCGRPSLELKVDEPTVASTEESTEDERMMGQKSKSFSKSELRQNCGRLSLELKDDEPTIASTKKCIDDEGLKGQKSKSLFKSELRQNCSSASLQSQVKVPNVASPEECIADEGLTGQKSDSMVKSVTQKVPEIQRLAEQEIEPNKQKNDLTEKNRLAKPHLLLQCNKPPSKKSAFLKHKQKSGSTSTGSDDSVLFTPDIVVKKNLPQKKILPKKHPSGESQDCRKMKKFKEHRQARQHYPDRTSPHHIENPQKVTEKVLSHSNDTSPSKKFELHGILSLDKTKTVPNKVRFDLYGSNREKQIYAQEQRFSAPATLTVSDTYNDYRDVLSAKQKVHHQWSSTFIPKTKRSPQEGAPQSKKNQKTQDALKSSMSALKSHLVQRAKLLSSSERGTNHFRKTVFHQKLTKTLSG